MHVGHSRQKKHSVSIMALFTGWELLTWIERFVVKREISGDLGKDRNEVGGFHVVKVYTYDDGDDDGGEEIETSVLFSVRILTCTD